MPNTSNPMFPPARPGRVLLVGDIGRAFLDANQVDRYPCDVCVNVLDGIRAAAQGHFDVVGVVIDGASRHLGSVLRALRKGSSARIILLARMHEEPIARRLVAAEPGQEKLADAYVICPVRLASFCRHAGVAEAAQTPGAPSTERQETVPAELEQRIRYLERLATTDDLTGLKNRRYIREFAGQILEQARGTGGRVTLLVFDIDNFKHYNDVYGHATGDEILRQAALLVRRCCRPHDVVGRIGGDEFAVVFWDDPHRPSGDHRAAPPARMPQDRRSAAAEHPTEAISVAKRFQKEFGNADLHLLGPEGEGVLTISGGLASFPRDGATVEQLFERADQALLEAKRSGKNRIYLVGEPQSDIAEIE